MVDFSMIHPTSDRTGFETIVRGVLDELESGVDMSIAKLSRKLGVDRRSVSKVIDLLLDIQSSLVSHQIETKKTGRAFIIRFNYRTRELTNSLKAALRNKVLRRRT
jgi:hypothetical protein